MTGPDTGRILGKPPCARHGHTRLNRTVNTPVDVAAARALAEDLRAAGFTSASVRDAWGPIADDAIARGLHGPALTALRERSDALATLARLFVLGISQPASQVDAALPRGGARGAAALGVVRLDSEAAHPLVLIRPQEFADEAGSVSWLVASDLDEAALGGALPEDHVLGVGGASLTLASLQLPTPAARGLDVGTGCGIQTLRARRAVDTVVATDISVRAIWFATLNAIFNDLDGVEVREGSLFEPVAGERFDRIVSNPPFVITPRVDGVPAYEYRDGGMVGDALVEAFVTGVGAHLEPGGVAQLLGNWEYREGEDGLDRVRAWVAASGVALDAWIVEREQLDPLAYAELWIRDGGTTSSTAGFADLVDAWLDDFTARGVTGVGFGYLLLRRPASGAPTLSRFERVTQPVAGALGPHLADALVAHDALAGIDDEMLARAVLQVAPDVTEARHHMPGAEAPSVIELRQGGGFGRALEVDPALAALVGASDGELAVGVLVDAIADLLEVDAVALRTDILPRIRELIFTGFLTFA